jgi:ABC-type sugar transport system substrate-binding protein
VTARVVEASAPEQASHTSEGKLQALKICRLVRNSRCLPTWPAHGDAPDRYKVATTSKIQATAHLLTARHRRVLFLGGTPGFSSADERRLGHQNALRAHGIPNAEELDTSGDCTRKSGYLHTREALRTGVEFTAVFARQAAAPGANCRPVSAYRSRRLTAGS